MSIAVETQNALRSFRSLIGFEVLRVSRIKVLKDLDNRPIRFSIDM